MMELEIPMIKQVYWEGNQCVDMLDNVARNEEYEEFDVFGMAPPSIEVLLTKVSGNFLPPDFRISANL